MRGLLARLRAWLAKLRSPVIPGPTSSNGASSFHLWWELPGDFKEVSVTLEVIDPPLVSKLFFWALQVGFSDQSGRRGAAHLGLQHHPSYPHRTAVNWGGYDQNGEILAGSGSPLPSALGNANTRNYHWEPRRKYRLRVYQSEAPPPTGGVAWRGEVTDVETGVVTIVRDLYTTSDFLTSPVVWSEVFALCRDRGAAVRWSDFEAITIGGDRVNPRAVRLNYQSPENGGCPNTDSRLDGPGRVVQRSGIARGARDGTKLYIG